MTLFWDFYLIAGLAMTVALMVRSHQLDRLQEKSIMQYILAGMMWPLVLAEFLRNKQ